VNIYVDIETLPSADPVFARDVAATIKAPGQYKKQDSIDAWLAENRDAAVAEIIAKTSFDGLNGRIACICYAIDDGPVMACANNAEGQMLMEFYAAIEDTTSIDTHGGWAHHAATFVGHNLAGFDLPFLKHRSILNNVKPPAFVLKAMNAKSWDTCIADTMLMWSPDRERRVSMDKLCKALGIAGKGDFDGSMVAATWPVDPGKVIEYCKQDVERTRAIYKRITFQGQ